MQIKVENLLEEKSGVILDSIPDFLDYKKARQWILIGLKKNRENQHSNQYSNQKKDQEIFFLEYKSIHQDLRLQRFNLCLDARWRKFVLGCFFSDLISYPSQADQVDFPRLAFVMSAYPERFRMAILRSGKTFWPVGYTGSYPISKSQFEFLEKKNLPSTHRWIPPEKRMKQSSTFVFLFNYSVSPFLKKTELSRCLMRGFFEDLKQEQVKGFACFCISEDGKRIAKRLGMQCVGAFGIEGNLEECYISRSIL